MNSRTVEPNASAAAGRFIDTAAERPIDEPQAARAQAEASPDDYERFIHGKRVEAPVRGFDAPLPLSPILKPFQGAIVLWALKLGCAAVFASFGLGKSMQQLEWSRQCAAHTGKASLIIAPLGVRAEFLADAGKLGVGLTFIRTDAEANIDGGGLYLTNYESVREGKIDPRRFGAVSLDEADVLRGMGGTKTFREFMAKLEHGPVRYKLVATATPAPNDYQELLAYAAFLGVMDIGDARTRFFKRNPEKADDLTLHPHKEDEFWAWVASWACVVSKPSDIDPSFDDSDYVLPELRLHWHELATDHREAGLETNGQAKLVKDSAEGIVGASREKRDSLPRRVAKLEELVRGLCQGGNVIDQPVIWVDQNAEQKAVEGVLTKLGVTCVSLYGKDDPDKRDAEIGRWKRREVDAFVSKPVMFGAGVNLQQSHTMIFAGIGYKAKDWMQAVHRIYRFLQRHPCDVHMIYTDAEREVRRALEEKWAQHKVLVARMTTLVHEHGLSKMREIVRRAIDVNRVEVTTHAARLVNNDCVIELRSMDSNSIGAVVSSVPFSMQYEYSPHYRDFGHNESNEGFWKQMRFLIPELLRVLQPGRIAAIHVKDRIVPGGLNGLGFQTVYPFHADAIREFTAAGFGYMGMITVVTDVVRENNQTYRLSYTEQCHDGTKMGVGMPEYILLFRKPQTDTTKSYADQPVVKQKDVDEHGAKRAGERVYSLGRWQIDAHSFHRSSGNRLLRADELEGLTHAEMFKLFRAFSLSDEPYDYEHHVSLNDKLAEMRKLPTTFMLLQPQSRSPHVWSDVMRARTLNNAQSAQGRENHVCPLQFDIVERLINRFTMEGETVLDPFGGIGTVAYCATRMKRRAVSVELNPAYHRDAVRYARDAEREMGTPTLFDLLKIKDAPASADDDVPAEAVGT